MRQNEWYKFTYEYSQAKFNDAFFVEQASADLKVASNQCKKWVEKVENMKLVEYTQIFQRNMLDSEG